MNHKEDKQKVIDYLKEAEKEIDTLLRNPESMFEGYDRIYDVMAIIGRAGAITDKINLS